ncbi:MAG: hypothetical protein AABX90_03435 [Nanoarchaeota archaeon]
MDKKYTLIFDDIILKQLKQAGKNQQIRTILSKIFDKIEELGPRAGDLVDSQLFIYEVKLKSPPIRLYYRYNKNTDEIFLFEYEMKTSKKKQQKTIEKIKKRALET